MLNKFFFGIWCCILLYLYFFCLINIIILLLLCPTQLVMWCFGASVLSIYLDLLFSFHFKSWATIILFGARNRQWITVAQPNCIMMAQPNFCFGLQFSCSSFICLFWSYIFGLLLFITFFHYFSVIFILFFGVFLFQGIYCWATVLQYNFFHYFSSYIILQYFFLKLYISATILH